MKKILLLIFVSILTFTGCGKNDMKTMKCTYKNASDTMSTNITYNIDHMGDEIKKVRIMYHYEDLRKDDNRDDSANTDGIGTGTDGTTSDTQIDNDGIVDGIVGSAIDSVINGMTNVILDVSGLRDRHSSVQGTYGTIPGFSFENTDDIDNSYKVNYVVDYDMISDDDLSRLNLSRDLDTLRSNYVSQGFTCQE